MNLSVRKMHPLILILVAGLLVWGWTIRFDFVWDDFPMIFNNPSLLQTSTWIRGWSHDFWMLHDSPQWSGYWRPMATMVHVFMAQTFGLHPWAFHALNVLLVILTAFFFFRFLQSMGLGDWAWVAVLFFLWHPLMAETVSFNSAIPDLLFSFFGWSSTYLWIQKKKTTFQKWMAPILLAACFLSKESGLFFGIFILGLEFFPKLNFPKKDRKNRVGIVLGLMSAYIFFHYLVIHGFGTRDKLWGGDLIHHVATVCKLFAYQLFLLIIPIGSSPVRDLSTASFLDPLAWIGLFLLIFFVGLFFFFRKKKPQLSFMIFFYFVFWFPVSNILPAEGLIADRYLLMPLMAFSFGLVYLLSLQDTLQPRMIGLILLLLGIWAVTNSMPWKNSETLWAHAVDASPKSSVAWNEWGNVLFSKQEYLQAYEAYDRAFGIQPEYREASLNRSMTLFVMEDSRAEKKTLEHLKNFPSDAQGYDLLGSVYERESDLPSALDASVKAVSLAPDQWKLRYNLAEVYLRVNDPEKAIKELVVVSHLTQNRDDVVKNLAAAYCQNGQYKECVDTYQDYVRKFPEKKTEVEQSMEKAKQLLQIVQGRG